MLPKRNKIISDLRLNEREGFKPVVQLSGGRTSAMMLYELLKQVPDYRTRFITCFENTGKERDETLDFLHKIEVEWNVPLVWLEYDRVPASEQIRDTYPHKASRKFVQEEIDKGLTSHWFRIVDYKSACRNLQPNSPFDKLIQWSSVLPNVRARICSVQLKTRTMLRYVYSISVFNMASYIGFRYDEKIRSIELLASCGKRERPQFPLIDLIVTKRIVNEFWKKQPFDLQLKDHEGNCDLCFLKAKWKRLSIARSHPEYIDWWEQKEKEKGNMNTPVFRMGDPYSKLRLESQHPEFQIDGEDIGCACMEGSFHGSDDINCSL
jgi:hypothetical protein